MSRADELKKTIFRDVSAMPGQLREYWQIAYLFRAKYAGQDGRTADEIYAAAIADMQQINAAYNNSDTLMQMLLEVYDDIVRQTERKGDYSTDRADRPEKSA